MPVQYGIPINQFTEKIQRRAARWVLNDYIDTAVQHQCSNNCSGPHWKRDARKLGYPYSVYKAKNNLKYHHTTIRHILFKQDFVTNLLLFIRLPEHLHNSFFPRIIKEWNTLPSSTTTSDSLTMFNRKFS